MWQAVDPARAGKITGMLLELDVPLNVHKIVGLIVSPVMVRSTSPGSRYTRSPAWLRLVPQLLDIINEAQTVLDSADSPGGDQSNSPDSDPGAKSTDGLEARTPARVLNIRACILPRPADFPGHTLCARRRYWRR